MNNYNLVRVFFAIGRFCLGLLSGVYAVASVLSKNYLIPFKYKRQLKEKGLSLKTMKFVVQANKFQPSMWWEFFKPKIKNAQIKINVLSILI